MTIDKGKILVAKWQPRFGLANFRIHCLPCANEDSMAESHWDSQCEWGVVWLPDDDDPEMQGPVLELTVLHELCHGMLSLAVPDHDHTTESVERFCNRIARLARSDFQSLEPAELLATTVPGWQPQGGTRTTRPSGEGSETPPVLNDRAWLGLVVDSLPTDERDCINALYYEGLSLRQYMHRAHLTHATEVARLRDKALAHIQERFAALERSFKQWP